MTIEHAIAHSLKKPWGVENSRPWSSAGGQGSKIGEVWYERSSSTAEAPSLLLKLLFTSEPLSIQVHPDNAYAQSVGLPNGKTEAWYVLSAEPDAKVGLGLKRRLSPQEMRQAAGNGSIADLVVWQAVRAGETVSVPAKTIHAIGAGLVIAEIQQRSDSTFRLFDHGRGRELHIEDALAVANARPADVPIAPSRLTDARVLLTSNTYFTFEKIDLAPDSTWHLETTRETWLLVVGGSARTDSFNVAMGDAVFAQSDCVNIRVGAQGLSGLLAYTGGLVPELLQCAGMEATQ